MKITHTFVSPKVEQSDPTLVGPNEWNASHTVVNPIVVQAEDYGAVGDGVTDDTAALQSAINAVQGTGKVLWLSKTYKITSQVTATSGNFAIDGFGTLKPTGTAYFNAFVVNGALGSVNTSVTLDVNGNFSGRFLSSTLSITVGSVTGITAGTWLILSYSASSTRFFVQVAQVLSVSGNTVTFTSPIYIPMDHTQSSTVTSFTPIQNVTIQNLTIDMSGYNTGPLAQGLTLNYAIFCTVRNIKLQNAQGNQTNNDSAPLYFLYGYGNLFDGITSYNCGGHNGDMWFAYQTSCQMDHIRSFGYTALDAHGPDFSSCVDCQVGSIISNSHSGRGIRVLACVKLRFANITVADNADNGCFITWNSYDIYIKEIFAYNNISSDGLVYGGDNEDYIVIDRFVGSNNQGSQISDLTSTTHSRVNQYLGSTLPIIQPQNVIGWQDNLVLGTSVAGSVTINSALCMITTESLTTAALNQYTLGLTNNRIIPNGRCHVNVVLEEAGTNTGGVPIVKSVQTGSGICYIRIYNAHASQAFNGTLVIKVQILGIG